MELRAVARNKQKEYRRLFAKLRARRSAGDDALFETAHTGVFNAVNCLDCANCCKTHSPILLEADIRRIAAYLGIRQHRFMSNYLMCDEDGDWVFHTQPCPFLENDNRCAIYDVRPKACSEYPHTNRKRMYQLEKITLKNAEICPAVSRILDAVITKINQKCE